MSNFDLVKKNVDDLLNINPEPNKTVEKIHLQNGALTLNHVTMASRMHESHQSYTFSLDIPDGSVIGIKGNLPRDDHQFLRLIRGGIAVPEAGEIVIGGKNLNDLHDADLSDSIAMCQTVPPFSVAVFWTI